MSKKMACAKGWKIESQGRAQSYDEIKVDLFLVSPETRKMKSFSYNSHDVL